MATLHLALKGEYFDAIREGTKTQEFRLANAYWEKRLSNPGFDEIVITRGYPAAGDDSRRLRFPWRGFERTTITHPHFGPLPVEVFAINLAAQGEGRTG